MSKVSMKEALVAKLHHNVVEIAEYTCKTVTHSNVVELACNDPSFEEIKSVCESLLEVIKAHTEADERIQQVEEIIGILGEIIYAIPNDDNPLLIDCTYHLEQFLDMHVRNRAI